MIEQKCTANEIDFLLYISRFQDSTGRVAGVYYRDVCDAIGVSIQGYYDIRDSLARKGFIEYFKCDYSDCDIVIKGNAYTGEDYNRAGYINTNHNIFFCQEFKELKAGAKVLAMKLMMITFAGKGYFEIGVKKFYDKETGYQKRFGVSRRVMRSYLMSLKPLFSIGIKDGKYYIEPKKIIYRAKGSKEEAERYREKGTQVVLRRNRIKEPGEGEQAIRDLFKQYEKTADEEKRNLVQLISQAVSKSLEIINAGKSWLQYKFINIKLVHKLLRMELFGSKEAQLSEVKAQLERGITKEGDRPAVRKKAGFDNLNTEPEDFYPEEYSDEELEELFSKIYPANI